MRLCISVEVRTTQKTEPTVVVTKTIVPRAVTVVIRCRRPVPRRAAAMPARSTTVTFWVAVAALPEGRVVSGSRELEMMEAQRLSSGKFLL